MEYIFIFFNTVHFKFLEIYSNERDYKNGNYLKSYNFKAEEFKKQAQQKIQFRLGIQYLKKSEQQDSIYNSFSISRVGITVWVVFSIST